MTTVARPRVIWASLLSMIGLVALGATRVVHGILVTRATDKPTYGVVSMLIGLAMAASLFLPGGLASAATRFIPFYRGAGDEARATTAYRVLTLAGYAGAVVLGLVVGFFSRLLPGVTVGDAVAVGVLTAVYSGYSVAKGALYGFDRVVPYTWLEIAGSVVAVVATIVVVGTGSTTYLLPLTIGYAVLMLGALVVLRSHARGPAAADSAASLTTSQRRELSSYVWLASAGGLASAGLLSALPTLAGWFSTADEIAYFGAGVTLVAPLFFLPRALGMALFPAMSQAHGAGEAEVLKRHMDVSTRALFAVLAPLFAIGILIAPEVLSIYGGSGYAAGAPVLRVLLVATFVGSVQVGAQNSLSSGEAFRIPAWGAVGGAVIGLAVLWPLGHWLGAVGVGIAYLVAVAVTAAVPISVAWRRYEMDWAGPVARAAIVIIVALVVAAVLRGVLADLLGALLVGGTGAILVRGDISRVLAARH